MERLAPIKNDVEKLQELAEYYDTAENERVYEETLDWPIRWNKILDLIEKQTPDIIVLQELDHFDQALIDLKRLGYIANKSGNDIPYMPMWKNVEANAESYLDLLNAQSYAFMPKLLSKARKFGTKRGMVDADDDGSVVFWKEDRFNLVDIQFCQFYKYESDEKDEDGAMGVILKDNITNEDIVIITSHLPSGQIRERELERMEILSDTPRGIFRQFITDLKDRCPRMIIALDANSDPTETYEDSDQSASSALVNNVWTSFRCIDGLQSVWDDYFDQNGRTIDECNRPITVNKIRGPLSNQPKKIGVHSLELIDHVFYSQLQFEGFVNPPIQFNSKSEALMHLIPNQSDASDHYPVITDFAY
jgi:exonuclease III